MDLQLVPAMYPRFRHAACPLRGILVCIHHDAGCGLAGPMQAFCGRSAKATPFWGVGATGAEVEVDTETGAYTITKLVNVADVGAPINPRLLRAQLSGAGIMQLGFKFHF